MSSIAEGDDGLASFTDRKDFNTYLSIQPFSQIKNKWISGLTFEYGSWFCNVDDRAQSNGCARYRVQDHGDGGRQTFLIQALTALATACTGRMDQASCITSVPIRCVGWEVFSRARIAAAREARKARITS